MAHGYKIRNGNFMDVWKAILEISNSDGGTITFDGKTYKRASINGMAKQVIEKLLAKDDYKGIANYRVAGNHTRFCPWDSGNNQFDQLPIGFSVVRSAATLSPSPPRQKIDDLDILVIEFLENAKHDESEREMVQTDSSLL